MKKLINAVLCILGYHNYLLKKTYSKNKDHMYSKNTIVCIHCKHTKSWISLID